MKLKTKTLLTVAFFAQTLSAPLAANCFNSCWGSSKPVEEEVSPAEAEQAEEKTIVEVVAIEKTPFELCVEAVSQGDIEAFRENLAFIEDVDAKVEGFSLIGIIAGAGTVEQLEIFLERDPKVNVYFDDNNKGLNVTPLQMACLANNTGVAKALVLNAGADVNFFKQDSGNFTPLHVAILTRNLELVRFFIENGADQTLVITIKGEEKSVLDIAIFSKNPDIEYLIREALEAAEEVAEEVATAVEEE